MFFFLQDAPQKVDNIHQAICFAILSFSFIQKLNYIALIRIAVNAIFLFTIAQAASSLNKYTIDQPRFQ